MGVLMALLFLEKYVRAVWRVLVWGNLRFSQFSDPGNRGGGTSWFYIVGCYTLLLAAGMHRLALNLAVFLVIDLGMEVPVFVLLVVFVL